MPGTDDDRDLAATSRVLPLAAVRAAVDRLDWSDPDWAALQWILADRLHDRYLDDHDAADLTEALDRGRRAVALLERQGGAPADVLADLALIVFDTVQRAGDGDIGECIELLERAMDRAGADPDGVVDRALYGARLARILMSREPVDDADRRRAVELWERAAECADMHPDLRAISLSDLAAAYIGPDASPADIRRAVIYGWRATTEDVADPEFAADARFQLAVALGRLHEIERDGGHLAEAITVTQDALALLGADHPDHPGYTADLVQLIRQRGRETSDVGLLTDGLRLIRDAAIARTDDEHPDRHLILEAAAAICADLGWQTDDRDLVLEAVALHRRAARLPDVDPDAQVTSLINAASALRNAADHGSDAHLLDEGVRVCDEALARCPRPGSTRVAALTAASNLLRDRHARRGAPADLAAAIGYAEESLARTPSDDDLYAVRQTNLAVVLSDRYTERGSLPDLDRAVRLYREALATAEPVRWRIAERENDLALALRDRFATSYDHADLTEAVDLAERSVADTPRQSSAWPGYATNLGNALMERFEVDRRKADLDRAIELFGDALERVAGRPADESGFATNLGLALAERALIAESVDSHDEAVAYLTRAAYVLPEQHPDAAHRLSNLAELHIQRARLDDRAGRTEEATNGTLTAVATARRAVAEAGDHDARLLPALANLARAMRLLHRLDPGTVDLRDIVAVQCRAARLDRVPAVDRFPQAVLWARDAVALGDEHADEAMSAYRLAVELTSEVAWIGLSPPSRQTLLDQMSEALTGAVSFAVCAGHHWEALAWADRVRSVLWQQTVRVKSVTEAASSRAADTSLRDLFSFSPFSFSGEDPNRERRRAAAHRALAGSTVPVPEPSGYAELRFPGTLVLLVPGPAESVALLLDGNGGAHTVVLPVAGESEVNEQAGRLRESLLLLDDPDVPDATVRHRVFDCLDWVWRAIAKPILDELPGDRAPRHRVWWSSLGGFALLPIHAAGRYPRKRTQLAGGRPGTYDCLADHVLSAYLPTIANMSADRAPAGWERPAGGLLYVSADGGTNPLDHAEAELAAVRGSLGGGLRSVDIDCMSGAAATVDAVRAALPRSSLLHVTAHGTVDAAAFASGFRLADGVLTLAHLADADVADGALATFLTCDSARGDAALPNEALHMAGAAMQAGYPEVVAAAMPLRDSSTVTIATAVYSAVANTHDPVGDSVAQALHDAVAALRQDPASATDPLSWAPLAYFGWGRPRPAESSQSS